MYAPLSAPASRFQNALFYVVIVASSGAANLLTEVPRASQLSRFISSANLSEGLKTSTVWKETKVMDFYRIMLL